MSVYPDPSTPPQRDLSYFMNDVYQKEVDMVDERGRPVTKWVPDLNAKFWAGQAVSSEEFSGIAAISGRLRGLMRQIEATAPPTVVEVVRVQVEAIYDEIREAVAAKNSETVRRGQAVSALQDKFAKHSSEHIYSSPEEATGKMLDFMTGKSGEG